MVSSTDFVIHSIIDKLLWIRSSKDFEEAKKRTTQAISFYSNTLQQGVTKHEIKFTEKEAKKLMEQAKKRKEKKGDKPGSDESGTSSIEKK